VLGYFLVGRGLVEREIIRQLDNRGSNTAAKIRPAVLPNI
jgi:hypothetical protein